MRLVRGRNCIENGHIASQLFTRRGMAFVGTLTVCILYTAALDRMALGMHLAKLADKSQSVATRVLAVDSLTGTFFFRTTAWKAADGAARDAGEPEVARKAAKQVVKGLMTEYGHVKVEDVSKPETIMVMKRRSQGFISGMTIRGSGRLDGNAEIVLLLNDKPYKTERLCGKISFQWGGDWFEDSATIEYRPSSAKTGELSLNYEFF